MDSDHKVIKIEHNKAHMVCGDPIMSMKILEAREDGSHAVSYLQLFACREVVFTCHFPLAHHQGRDLACRQQWDVLGFIMDALCKERGGHYSGMSVRSKRTV
jgi:hypothetical protein